MTIPAFVKVPAITLGVGSANWQLLKTAVMHYVKVLGNFKVTEFELKLFKSGNR